MSPSRFRILALTALAIFASISQGWAQTAPAQPYAGLQSRPIKALSDEQIADLVAGRGMSLALAAELNGYPGPSHVLEFADRLGLNEQQRAGVKRLFDSMKSEAIPLGQNLIEAEQGLDRAFAGRTITPERLKAATAAIAAIQGELRNTHLKYHLSTVALLSAEQIRRYAELRGYGGTAATSEGHPAGQGTTSPAHGRAEPPMHHRMMETNHSD